MSVDHDYPKLAIDHGMFTRALDGGAFDTCLEYLYHDTISGTNTALLVCRLGEKLFYAGRRSDAVACGRLAFAAAANDNEVAHFCAWLFSNSGCYAEAAAAYERLLEQRPDWSEGYRHASGAFAAAGAHGKAIDLAVKASDLEPANFAFAYHAGCLLLDAERDEEAALYLTRAVSVEPHNPAALRALSVSAYGLDRVDEALSLALEAASLAPEDNGLTMHAAELLLRAGRVDAAAALLDAGLTRDPHEPMLWRLLSAAESQRDAGMAALAAIDHALHFAPDNAEYHLHRGHLLFRTGEFAAAAEAVNRAAELDPASAATRRAQLDLLMSSGRVSEATAAGGELLRAFPEDEPTAEAVLRVLNRRLDTIDGDYTVLGDRRLRLPRPARKEPGFVERLRSQMRVICALIIRETRTRFGDSRLGYGWALIEPILHITLLWVMFSLLMRGSPPIGSHFFVFYFTGLLRYSGANGTSEAVTPNGGTNVFSAERISWAG